jgi:hypothetical protein
MLIFDVLFYRSGEYILPGEPNTKRRLTSGVLPISDILPATLKQIKKNSMIFSDIFIVLIIEVQLNNSSKGISRCSVH